MKAPFGRTYYEDPSVSRCCAIEYDRLWNRIADRVSTGESFYRAREIVLAEEVADIDRAYGTEVAKRVCKAIQHTDPEKIPKWAKRAQKEVLAAICEDVLIKRRGKVSWINRIFLRLTGTPLYC